MHRTKFAIALAFLSAPTGLLLPSAYLLPPALAQATNPRQVEADRLLEQGLSQFQTGGIEAAFQSWQQALAIYRSLKDRLGEGKALGNLGIAYRILGDFDQAIASQQQYLAIARELKDRESEGMAIGNLGNLYYLLGQFNKAIEYQQQWLAIARETKDRQSEGSAERRQSARQFGQHLRIVGRLCQNHRLHAAMAIDRARNEGSAKRR